MGMGQVIGWPQNGLVGDCFRSSVKQGRNLLVPSLNAFQALTSPSRMIRIYSMSNPPPSSSLEIFTSQCVNQPLHGWWHNGFSNPFGNQTYQWTKIYTDILFDENPNYRILNCHLWLPGGKARSMGGGKTVKPMEPLWTFPLHLPFFSRFDLRFPCNILNPCRKNSAFHIIG